MIDLVKADGPACVLCAARTLTPHGSVCEVWKLGSSNNEHRKNKRFVFGRNHKSGTTMRPILCPHPDHKVSTTPSVQSMMFKLLKK